MNSTWYLHRLKKMGFAEVAKRFGEHVYIHYSRIKYRNTSNWSYTRFAPEAASLVRHRLPSTPLIQDWKHYPVYNLAFDLTKPLDWHFSDKPEQQWPKRKHFPQINYRPGNTYGDVRINWELNRLQFLPVMACKDEELAKTIIDDWIRDNPYLYGPAYLFSMEVALRWLSIYWALCLFKNPVESHLERSLTGLAIASGHYIEKRLSTHSSAGNHLIVEAAGLFWIGKALENSQIGQHWIAKSRAILAKQVTAQLNPDGTNKEQSFWYLGFVLDAVFHYFLLEDRQLIAKKTWEQIEKVLEFMDNMVLEDGSFPDYGDRDDGFVFRVNGTYKNSPFPGLLNIGTFLFNQSGWYRDCSDAVKRLEFWTSSTRKHSSINKTSNNRVVFPDKPQLKTYSHGGMTLMKWAKGRLLFRHACLGRGNTCGHGHADALSVLFSWNNIPILIDLGSGQYNGDQDIRNFFRSTIAHNTLEIGGKNQSKVVGPFLWQKSYETHVTGTGMEPSFFIEAYHTGYENSLGIVHKRRVNWLTRYHIEIVDAFSGSGTARCQGAFHLGECTTIKETENHITADFGDFIFSITFPPEFIIKIFYGSDHPFMGWRSTIYGAWEPIYSIIFSFQLSEDYQYKTILKIVEN